MLKKFVFDAMLAENSLSALASEGISVRGSAATPPTISLVDKGFSPRLMYNAEKMASVFTAYFFLENSARELICERLASRHGADWWNLKVPLKIKQAVEKLQEKEAKNRYHTARSVDFIGYTLFGHLAQIIIVAWDDFSDLFPDQAWVSSRFNDLEMSRNIIMHTGTLPQIEVDRVESILTDWTRQVG